MRRFSYIAVFLSLAFNLVAQLLFARISSTLLVNTGGISNLSKTLPILLQAPIVYLSLLAFSMGSLLWVIGLRGMSLSKAFAITSLGYVIITIYSFYFLNEEIRLNKIISLFLIITGVILITEQKKSEKGHTEEVQTDSLH